MNTELVVIEKHEVRAVFTDMTLIDPILQKIADDARSIVADVATVKGRKEIASVAFRVAQSKTYLDGLGKDLVAEMKELPKKVDASRKHMRDFLDALKDEVRKPLDDWEAEQKEIEAKRLADEQAAKDAAQLEADHEIALLMDEAFNRAAEDARKAAEQAQLERDAALVQEAATRAKEEAEDKAKSEKDASDKRELEARLNQARAEADLIRAAQELKDAEAKAAQDLIEANRRAELAAAQAVAEKIAAAAEAARREKEAAQRERDKQAAEVQRLANEKAAREADTAHKAKINRAAVAAMIAAGITEEQAKAVLLAIYRKKVPNVSINY